MGMFLVAFKNTFRVSLEYIGYKSVVLERRLNKFLTAFLSIM